MVTGKSNHTGSSVRPKPPNAIRSFPNPKRRLTPQQALEQVALANKQLRAVAESSDKTSPRVVLAELAAETTLLQAQANRNLTSPNSKLANDLIESALHGDEETSVAKLNKVRGEYPNGSMDLELLKVLFTCDFTKAVLVDSAKKIVAAFKEKPASSSMDKPAIIASWKKFVVQSDAKKRNSVAEKVRKDADTIFKAIPEILLAYKPDLFQDNDFKPLGLITEVPILQGYGIEEGSDLDRILAACRDAGYKPSHQEVDQYFAEKLFPPTSAIPRNINHGLIVSKDLNRIFGAGTADVGRVPRPRSTTHQNLQKTIMNILDSEANPEQKAASLTILRTTNTKTEATLVHELRLLSSQLITRGRPEYDPLKLLNVSEALLLSLSTEPLSDCNKRLIQAFRKKDIAYMVDLILKHFHFSINNKPETRELQNKALSKYIELLVKVAPPFSIQQLQPLRRLLPTYPAMTLSDDRFDKRRSALIAFRDHAGYFATQEDVAHYFRNKIKNKDALMDLSKDKKKFSLEQHLRSEFEVFAKIWPSLGTFEDCIEKQGLQEVLDPPTKPAEDQKPEPTWRRALIDLIGFRDETARITHNRPRLKRFFEQLARFPGGETLLGLKAGEPTSPEKALRQAFQASVGDPIGEPIREFFSR